MYIGSQFGEQTDEEMRVLSQLGIKNVDQTPSAPWREWSTDMLLQMKERWAKHGISMEMIHIPLGSRSAYQNEAGAIFSQTERRARPPDRLDERDRADGGRGWPPRPQLQHHPSWGICGRPRRPGAEEPRYRPLSWTNWISRWASSRMGRPMKTKCGRALTTGCRRSCPWPKSTRSRWPAIRPTRALAWAIRTGAWRVPWGWSRASKSSSRSTTVRTTG